MNWAKLLNAIELVEGGACKDPRNLIGDNGLAWGTFQIHPGVVLDVNKVYGLRFQPEDRWSPTQSRIICALYTQWYTRMVVNPQCRDFALCWHYGPSFMEAEHQSDPDGYWDKVRVLIN